jgi:polyisoprenoid-binding protein YceI
MPRIATLMLLVAALFAADDLDELKKGSPLPAGQHHFVFPSMAKQSIAFHSEADEEIFGTVAFPDGDTLGTLQLDADTGLGSGSATIQAAWMRTGNDTRDEHMLSAGWLDAASHPTISFSEVKLKRVEGTLYEISGIWTIHGVSQELSSHANVRLVPLMRGIGENLVKVKATFDIDLKAFGLTSPGIGSPAVAQVWQITVSLLGVPQ